jgi:cation diffusion facilitator family transporter
MAVNNPDAIQILGDNDVSTLEEDSQSRTPSRSSQVRRKTSIRRSFSVSFQENGFSWRETTAEGSNQDSKFDFTRTFEDEEVIDDVLDASDVSRILPENRSHRQSRCSCSLENKAQKNYQSIEPGTPSGSVGNSTPIVFCIHGNKFGVARCCEDLSPDHVHEGPVTFSGNLDTPAPNEDIHGSGELHCHTSEREDGIDKKARNRLIIASVLCLFFMVLEIVGGFWANSLAIATDAAHLLTDFASFMISLFSIWVASRPATRRMSFGWHRAEVIGATVSVLMIWVVTGILVYVAIQRIISGDYEIDATIMLITSGVGVGVNIIMGCTLHQSGHGHTHGGGGGHGHAHAGGVDPETGETTENINVRAAFIHVVGDFLQSLGVFIAAIIIYSKPTWVIIDPICTFIFSVLVLFTTIKILRDTMNVLMEGIPPSINFEIVQDTFLSVEGIVAVHNLRIWGLTTDKVALSAHLAIDPSCDAQTILRDASARIRAKYNFYEMTLQVEEFEQDMDSCNQCKPPKL